jgi:hypothetical protein
MTGQTVTPTDLEHGWRCEACNRPFQVGDIATPHQYGVINGEFYESDWICETCEERMHR